MTTPTYTPGPWWPHKNSAGTYQVLTHRGSHDADRKSPYGATICMGIGDHTSNRTNGNERENAYLIAAAPDLLAQAEKCLSWMIAERDCYYESYANPGSGYVHDADDLAVLDSLDRDIDDLRAVIARAKGEAE